MNKIFKYHALGNDYLVIDPNKFGLDLTEEMIKMICHRNFGAGSDGILFGPIIHNNEISLKIYNPDGSEAEKSGNGIRIFSKYLKDYSYVKDTSFKLNTKGGQVSVYYKNEEATEIKVEMGIPSFDSNDIGIYGNKRYIINETLDLTDKTFKITSLTIGNPHTVIICDDEVNYNFVHKYGELIENHEIFINRTNVQFVNVINRNSIKIKIWERGAGYTLSSGSSSCAAAMACKKLNLVDNIINVICDGGNILIEIDENDKIFMTGNVSMIYEGELKMDLKCYYE